MKSSASSAQFRDDGNRAFKKGDMATASDCYNSAICAAPGRSPELALSLANRAMLLMKRGLYHECLRDIGRAENCGPSVVPSPVARKLVERRQYCVDNLLKKNCCATVADTTVETLPNRCCLGHTDKDAPSNSELNDISDLCSRNMTTITAPSPNQFSYPYCANVHPALSVRHSNAKGRYVVARDPIPAGAIILTESAFAWILLPSELDRHCWTCLRRLLPDPVPCDMCPDVRYCNESCRDDAWNRAVHEMECGHVRPLIDAGLMHLALRSVISCLLLLPDGPDAGCPGGNDNSHHANGMDPDEDSPVDLITKPVSGDWLSTPVHSFEPDEDINRNCYQPVLQDSIGTTTTDCRGDTVSDKDKMDSMNFVLNCLSDDAALSLLYPPVLDESYDIGVGMSTLQFHRLSPPDPAADTADATMLETVSNTLQTVSIPGRIESILERCVQSLKCRNSPVHCDTTEKVPFLDSASSLRTHLLKCPDQESLSETSHDGNEVKKLENNSNRITTTSSFTALPETHRDLLARLVLKHSLKLIVNATQITDPDPDTPPDPDGTRKSIGTGVYPIQCLLNHSCRPNIEIKYLGNQLVMRAKVDIPPGGELFNCYGPQAGTGMGVAERRGELWEQYQFYCECDACVEESETI